MKQICIQVYMKKNHTSNIFENQSRVFNTSTDLEGYLCSMKPLSNNYLFLVVYSIYTPLEHNSWHINNGSYYADFCRLSPTVSESEVKTEVPLTNENSNDYSNNTFIFDPPEPQINNDRESFEFKEPTTLEQSGENISLNMEDRPPSTDNTDWHFVEEKKELKNKFEGMTMRKHGRGYLLQCNDDHPDYGEKYYPNIGNSKAWWQNCNQGWFLRREHKKLFLDNGAEFVFT